jgi:hypothetical protein
VERICEGREGDATLLGELLSLVRGWARVGDEEFASGETLQLYLDTYFDTAYFSFIASLAATVRTLI